jgi:hypothetical protein
MDDFLQELTKPVDDLMGDTDLSTFSDLDLKGRADDVALRVTDVVLCSCTIMLSFFCVYGVYVWPQEQKSFEQRLERGTVKVTDSIPTVRQLATTSCAPSNWLPIGIVATAVTALIIVSLALLRDVDNAKRLVFQNSVIFLAFSAFLLLVEFLKNKIQEKNE